MTESQPFPAPGTSWWVRACYTPVGDVLHGKLTGRLDVRAAIAAANLPEPVAAKIYETVREARLSRYARLGLAQDLVTRSASQLAAGRPVETLVAELDTPEFTARSIRRAKAMHRRSPRWAASKEIVVAELPESVENLIESVVKQTRLWPRERLDVARELVAHFADGLASGRSADQLVADFGPPQQAARLIRQAKIRNRLRTWHAYRLAKRTLLLALAIGIVGYAAWSARFFIGQPRVEQNYWTQINSGRRGPETERAWPLYRAALIKLGKEDFQWMDKSNASGEPPDWPEWDAVLARHRESLELAHQAAGKKRLGYLIGDANDQAEIKAAGAEWLMRGAGPSEADNKELISAGLDGMQALRMMALVLQMDALHAARTGDGATAETDLNSLLSLSEQILESRGFIVEQLVAYAFFHGALDTIGEILRDHPTAFTDKQLHALAHRLAGYHGGVIDVDLASEQISFDDLLQRTFTDDGNDDGRITSAGLELLNAATSSNEFRWNSNPDASANALLRMAMPGFAALVGSRKENRDLFTELLDATIAQHQGPSWTWDTDAINETDERLHRMGQRDRIRYVLVQLMLPSISAVFNVVEYATQHRDATEVALALELWRRRNGSWPMSLDQLVPDLLPAVPPDRADGRPLRYALRDGKPVLYSLGFDRDDDGGRSARGKLQGRIIFGPVDEKQLESFRASTDDEGDWILWPQAVPVPQPFYLKPEPTDAQPEGEESEF